MSKAGCCYLTASAHSQWWGAEGSRRQMPGKGSSNPPAGMCWGSLLSSMEILSLWSCGVLYQIPSSSSRTAGCIPSHVQGCTSESPDLLHCHHTGHRSTFPPQREAELLHMRQSPSFCCSEDAGVPVPDEIRPVAASRETFQSLPSLRSTKFH